MTPLQLDPRLSFAARMADITRAQAKSLIVHWEDDEDAALIALVAADTPRLQIALDLHRTYASVVGRICKLRRDGRIE